MPAPIKVELVPYSTDWQILAQEESRDLRADAVKAKEYDEENAAAETFILMTLMPIPTPRRIASRRSSGSQMRAADPPPGPRPA